MLDERRLLILTALSGVTGDRGRTGQGRNIGRRRCKSGQEPPWQRRRATRCERAISENVSKTELDNAGRFPIR